MLVEVVSIFLILVAVTILAGRLKWDPFLTLVFAGLFSAAILLPATNFLEVYLSGFGGTVGQIAFIIIFGALLGNLMKESGQLEKLAELLFSGIFRNHRSLGLGLCGVLIGIPVFCDAGYLLMSRINKTEIPLNQRNSAILLAAGLYLTHTLVPPTPGPVAVLAAFNLTHHFAFSAIVGTLVAIVTLVLIYTFKMAHAQRVLERSTCSVEGKSSFVVLIPLIIPLILIALGTFLAGHLNTTSGRLLTHPIGALIIGCLLVCLLFYRRLEGRLSSIFSETLYQVTPIVLLTGAGGALGKVISSALVDTLSSDMFSLEKGFYLLFIIFLVTAAIKTLQGSSTAAMVISAAFFAPVLAHIQDDLFVVFASLCVGAGSLALSHTNDSFFWVIAKTEGWSTGEGLRNWTLTTFWMASLVFIILIAVYALLSII